MQQVSSAPAVGSAGGILEFGPFTLDLDGLALFVDGRDVRLTFSEFVLLKALAQKPYRVLDRAALRDAIREASPGSSIQVADVRLIDRHVARLRKKLREAGCDCIQTMRFAGYRFTPLDAETAPSHPYAGLLRRSG